MPAPPRQTGNQRSQSLFDLIGWNFQRLDTLGNGVERIARHAMHHALPHVAGKPSILAIVTDQRHNRTVQSKVAARHGTGRLPLVKEHRAPFGDQRRTGVGAASRGGLIGGRQVHQSGHQQIEPRHIGAYWRKRGYKAPEPGNGNLFQCGDIDLLRAHEVAPGFDRQAVPRAEDRCCACHGLVKRHLLKA